MTRGCSGLVAIDTSAASKKMVNTRGGGLRCGSEKQTGRKRTHLEGGDAKRRQQASSGASGVGLRRSLLRWNRDEEKNVLVEVVSEVDIGKVAGKLEKGAVEHERK
ncbi:hypothetical protein PIB30_019803 [Stylosanthes scabra]|uniref:Uncharacterized protein n=1 Tax=Stylosanthes scabra TaxID=79078 RepID=A0ABU6Z6X2_9FABA|nr:hypothetical protein [Stylosanthes scabra]